MVNIEKIRRRSLLMTLPYYPIIYEMVQKFSLLFIIITMWKRRIKYC